MSQDQLVALALKALIQEVTLTPKPGLVDPYHPGSHTDMDAFTFIDSCFALVPGFHVYYEIGAQHHGTLPELFASIRQAGINNEAKMFTATANVNTHKGANFMFGILIAAIAYLDYPDLETLQTSIQTMTTGLVQAELGSLTHFQTHGEKMYEQYGFTGIRGEVEAGIPHAFNLALPILQDDSVPYDHRLKLALLQLIATNDDANMVKRGGILGLDYGKSLAAMDYHDLDYHLSYMNRMFVQRNLSPGGSADLLAISIFLYLYDKEQSS